LDAAMRADQQAQEGTSYGS